jgi:prepilin-type N-terminal cleavage/methylation domain-containing protein
MKTGRIKIPTLPTKGYTLMEIMVVVAIISIVGSIVSPVFNANKVSGDAFKFVQSIRMARYKAIETQFFHRLVFIPQEERYLVQYYKSTDDWSNTVSTVGDASDPDNPEWVSIVDDSETYLTPGVSLEMERTAFFFRPDGLLAIRPSYDALLIPETIATFSYSDAVITVNFSSMGIVSSEEYNE